MGLESQERGGTGVGGLNANIAVKLSTSTNQVSMAVKMQGALKEC